MVLSADLVLTVDNFIGKHIHCKEAEFESIVQGPLLVFSNKSKDLVIVDLGQLVQLGLYRVSLGRDPSSDIVLDQDGVSRAHARLFFHKEEWFIEDSGSTNGLLQIRGSQRETLRAHEVVPLDPECRFGLGLARIQSYTASGIYHKMKARRPSEILKSSSAADQKSPFYREATPISASPNSDGTPGNMFEWAKNIKTLSINDFLAEHNHFFLSLLACTGSRDKSSHLDKTLTSTDLVQYSGVQDPRFWPLKSRKSGNVVLVGRNPVNDIVIAHATVSRKHACFHFDEAKAKWTIENIQSKNGVFLEGVELEGPREVDDEVSIRIGKEVLLQIHSPRTFFSILKVYAQIV
jgi:pSer/pThr/pTyr-binding forkhead associated (FHA) protein